MAESSNPPKSLCSLRQLQVRYPLIPSVLGMGGEGKKGRDSASLKLKKPQTSSIEDAVQSAGLSPSLSLLKPRRGDTLIVEKL